MEDVAFAQFDKQHKGSFGVAQLKSVFNAVGEDPSELELKEMIKALRGPHGKGEVTIKEFQAMLNNTWLEPDPQEPTNDCFKFLDKDANGGISIQDLQKALLAFGESVTVAEARDLFKAAGVQGDEMDLEKFRFVSTATAAKLQQQESAPAASPAKSPAKTTTAQPARRAVSKSAAPARKVR
eukprot:g70691.t1